MNYSRRQLAAALTLTPLVVAGCNTWPVNGKITFAIIQGYVKTIQAFVDKLAPIVSGLDPSEAARISQIQAQVDAAAAAFEALPANTGNAADLAGQIFQLTTAAITVAEALPLPPTIKDVLSAVQLLLILIGTFFNLPPAAAAGPPPPSLRAARQTYGSASDKRRAGDDASARVNRWLTSP